MTITITEQNLNNAGQTRHEANSNRSLGALYGKTVSELGDAHVVAIYSALLDGEWTHDGVTTALVKYGFNPQDYSTVLNDFREYGILNNRGTQFTPEFVSEAVTTSEQMAQNAPARMLPLTTEPTPWTTPFNHELNMDLVRTQATIKKTDAYQVYAYKNMPQVYEAVNKLQQVAFEVNPALMPYLDRMTTMGMDHIQAGQIATQKALLLRLVEAEKLFFYVTLDYRGRMYYRGGLLTPQGSDFQKAAFRFHEAKPLGKSGYNAMAVHFANLCGRDKLSLNDRMRWSASDEGLQHAHDVMSGKLVHGKKEKFQAIVTAAEWVRVHKLLDLGFTKQMIDSKLVIHQDGTCNGLQHGAALTGDRKTAINVNCVASTRDDIPADIYRTASETIEAEMVKWDKLKPLTAAVRHHGRKLMKLPIMVTGYGAGIKAVMNDFEAVMKENGDVDALANVETNEDTVEGLMQYTLDQECGAMIQLTQSLRKQLEDNWDRAIHLETPDGFMMIQASENKENFKYAGAGEYLVRVDTPTIDESAQMKGISPNFVHTIDATHLRNVVNNTDASIVSVHDSIGTHACDYRLVNKVVREQFVATHDFDWCGSFNHYNQTNLFLRTGDYDYHEALESNYLFS